MTQLVLIRHGQSVWNAENRFTGWVDSPLSSKGEQEAKKAGKLINNANIKIEYCYTSLLSRAITTLNLLIEETNEKQLKVIQSWELNERHYGALTGLNKLETKKKIGNELFLKYRRSWDIAPPEIENSNKYLKYYSKLNKDFPEINIPRTESLKDTYIRVISFFHKNIANLITKKKTVVISAHGNSLRALCKYLFNISDIQINNLEIPTGNPMVINFLNKFDVDSVSYLDENRALPIIQNI